MREHTILAAVIVAAVIITFAALTYYRKAALKRKQNREQIDKKMKEDALDRALSNGAGQGAQPRAKAPVEVHYNSELHKEHCAMLRLTEQAESISKEYLFLRTEIVYIGEEYGRAAVFQGQGSGTVCCELFPYQNDTYVRVCGRTECRLMRGKQVAPITEKAIRLRSGDRIETQTGVFLVELI